MIATKDGHILRYWNGFFAQMLTLLLIRYLWDGQLSRDYCLDLRRVPFCVDQQVLRGEIKFSSHYSLLFPTPFVIR